MLDFLKEQWKSREDDLSPSGGARFCAPWFWRLVFLGILGLGLTLRLLLFLSNPSLRQSEASLALNVIQSSFPDLVLKPLRYHQAAPPVFLMLTKALVSFLGKSEYVLRLLPFLSSAAGLFLYGRFLNRHFSRSAALTAFFLLSSSATLIFFSSDFKPYAVDVFAAVVIYEFSVTFLQRPLAARDGLIFGLAGAVLLWCSYASVFVLAGAGLALILRVLARRQREEVLSVLGMIAGWMVSFSVLYFVNLRAASSSPALVRYWKDAYLAFPVSGTWLTARFLNMLSNPGMIAFPAAGAAALLAGMIYLTRRSPMLPVLFLSPFLFALAASALQRYAFDGRLLLFAVPGLYAVMGEGIGGLLQGSGKALRFSGVVLALLLLGPTLLGKETHCFYCRHDREEIKPALHYLLENRQEGDTVYVYYETVRAFDYYAELYGFDTDEVVRGAWLKEDRLKVLNELEPLKDKKRVWVFLGQHFHPGDKVNIPNYMDGIAIREQVFTTAGADVYLYRARA